MTFSFLPKHDEQRTEFFSSLILIHIFWNPTTPLGPRFPYTQDFYILLCFVKMGASSSRTRGYANFCRCVPHRLWFWCSTWDFVICSCSVVLAEYTIYYKQFNPSSEGALDLSMKLSALTYFLFPPRFLHHNIHTFRRRVRLYYS